MNGSSVHGIFFFSSRRRHTRSLCDWSSDVCSSDLAVSGPASCPTPPSPSDTLASYVTVTDEASLVAAVGSAKPFEVIALNGFFPVSADVVITTPLVTLTCATPGSGIFAPQGSTVVFLLVVHAFGVTVDRLVLDGTRRWNPAGQIFLSRVS